MTIDSITRKNVTVELSKDNDQYEVLVFNGRQTKSGLFNDYQTALYKYSKMVAKILK